MVGHVGAVSQEEDANALAQLLTGLSEGQGSAWRSSNVQELLAESRGVLASQSDGGDGDTVVRGNERFFVRGKGALKGVVSNKDGDPMEGVTLLVWRYYGGTFVSMGQTMSLADGSFAIGDLPCGRYVVRMTHAKSSATSTIVLDEESIDVGEVVFDVDEADEEPKEEVEQRDEPEPVREPQKSPQPQEPVIPDVLEGETVVWSNVADYDGDGTREAFVLAGEWFDDAESSGAEVWVKPSLWFIPSDGEPVFVEEFRTLAYVNGVFSDPSGSGYTFLSVETTPNGPNSNSHVYGVREGGVVNVSPGGRDIQLYNGMMIIGHSFYAPQGGLFEEWFELTFDLESFQLVDGRSLGTTYVHQLP